MGKDSGTDVAQSTVSVDPEFREFYLDFANAGRDILNSGAGGQYFPGQTFVPMSGQTSAGLSAIEANAGRGMPGMSQAQRSLESMVSSGTPSGSHMVGTVANGANNYQTSSALGNIASGSQSNPFLGAVGQAGNRTNQNGGALIDVASSPTMGGRSTFQDAASGRLTNDAASGIDPASGMLGKGMSYLDETASGAFLDSNPYIDDVFNRAADQVAKNASAFGASRGIGGSEMNMDAFNDSISGLASDIYYNNYLNERSMMEGARSGLANAGLTGAINQASFGADDLNRQMAGASNLANMDMADRSAHMSAIQQAGAWDEAALNRGLSAAVQQAGLYNADVGNMLSAEGLGLSAHNSNINNMLGASGLQNTFLNDQSSRQATGIGLMPSVYSYGNMPGQDLMAAGATREGYAGAELQDAMQRHSFEQNNPWDRLAQYGAMLGIASPGAGTNQAQYIPNTTSPLLAGLGGAAALAPLGGVGAGIGGALGYLNAI